MSPYQHNKYPSSNKFLIHIIAQQCSTATAFQDASQNDHPRRPGPPEQQLHSSPLQPVDVFLRPVSRGRGAGPHRAASHRGGASRQHAAHLGH